MNRIARTGRLAAFALVAGAALTSAVFAEQRFSKDVGPAGACDAHEKGSTAWSRCVGAARVAVSDTELFYAGYWLAKSGKYEEALSYLSLANKRDEKVLTYIGFATRKLGRVDEAMPLYAKALEINPNYVVARAYLGEAYLTKGQPDAAKAQLSEIARRCGATCPEYIDLATTLSAYVAKQG